MFTGAVQVLHATWKSLSAKTTQEQLIEHIAKLSSLLQLMIIATEII